MQRRSRNRNDHAHVSEYLHREMSHLRYSDGMRGGNLGLMCNLLVQLDELSLSDDEDGVPHGVSDY